MQVTTLPAGLLAGEHIMRYVIKKKSERVFSFLLDDAGHAVEIHADALSDGPKVGDIYIALVQKVAKNISAAFVELIPGVHGYLPFDEIVEPVYVSKGPSTEIQAGDQLVVQITREAFGRKDPSVSTKLSLHGPHMVLIHGGMGVGISRRVPEEARKQLKDEVFSSEALDALQKRTGPCGLVVRTSICELFTPDADTAQDPQTIGDIRRVHDEVWRELKSLSAEMMDLKLKAPYRSVHSNLKKQPPRWLSRILSASGNEVEAVVTDDRDLYRLMLEAAQKSGKNTLRFKLYSDPLVSMEKVYSLERELERALDKRVHLKSGADLVIESTEALHIIDVNSGRAQSSRLKEEALLAVNLEAAREAARQIRLRNLSGIIVIDFINLKQQDNSLKILDALRKAVFHDPVRTQVVDMTKLGLVELTRQKIEVPLKDAASPLAGYGL